uniref:Calpain catalytic domain-containing protein n=1 Tax=Esox lucius TaxID=8010 RepID=A0A3P8YMS3_ESOLU
MPPPGVCMSIMQARDKNDGIGTLANPEKFNNQDFQQLKQFCLSNGYKYIDDRFPPDNSSIGEELLSPKDMCRVKWLRPAEIAKRPCFTVDGISRFDYGQGLAGNCWFLASIGALTFQTCIMEQVLHGQQSFEHDYCGIFHFKFWRFGRWVDVVIDDKLPTIDGQLIFVHSKTPNEFWPALMEKAYAKVCGSYADMNLGNPSEAMMDFTGGVYITFKLADAPPNLWNLLFRAAKCNSLMGCETPPGVSRNTVAPNGLVRGHAYTLTGIIQLMSKGRPVNLIRVYNPWGRVEWTGDWSDNSSLWQTVSPGDRKTCLSVVEDGEFWITVEDFCKHFRSVDICCLCPDFLDKNPACHWTATVHEGRWVTGTTAGGCLNFPDTFWINPQYQVKIEGLKKVCSETQGDYNILVTLMQKPDKRNRRLAKTLHIGFYIFGVSMKGHRGKFPKTFFKTNVPVAKTEKYIDSRTVMGLFWLNPGEYLIVPTSFNPDETASFILSIFSKTSVTGRLNSVEFLRLWSKATTYKDIFLHSDVDRSGYLSVSQLRNAIMSSGIRLTDNLLNLIALRYGGTSGIVSLGSFISLVLRMDRMASRFTM